MENLILPLDKTSREYGMVLLQYSANFTDVSFQLAFFLYADGDIREPTVSPFCYRNEWIYRSKHNRHASTLIFSSFDSWNRVELENKIFGTSCEQLYYCFSYSHVELLFAQL